MKGVMNDNDYDNYLPNEVIAEQAFHWATMLESNECKTSDREKFVRWLKESPTHIREFFLMVEAWDGLDNINALDREVLDSILEEHCTANNVIPLDPVRQADSGTIKSPSSRLPKWLYSKWSSAVATAAGIVIMVSVTLLSDVLETRATTYSTNIGEQRSFTLEDGSILHLNTQSRINVKYTNERRLIELLAGEAMFQVEHDKKRPFYVQTDDAVVRAVGTSFNVYRQQNGEDVTVVTVVEGKVAVSTLPKTEPETSIGDIVPSDTNPLDLETEHSLTAGGQLTVSNLGGVKKKEVSSEGIKAATAWRQRSLVFRSVKLKDVINEFNRYNRQKIIIKSEGAGGRQISGVFDADKPNTLITFLEKDKSIKVTRVYDTIVITDAPHDSKGTVISTNMIEH